MTLMKSLLLGSAAGLVAVASAQAADLPTKKGAPAAQYVAICTINGTTGFTIPGSDTCLKVYGLVHSKIGVGTTATPAAASTAYNSASAASAQNALGWYTRGLIGFTAVSNTAMGPLTADFAYDVQSGTGFDNAAGAAGLDHALITWAGLFVGTGNGSKYEGYLSGSAVSDDDYVSVDQSPTGQFGYTATLGGGLSATVSIDSPASTFGKVGSTATSTQAGTRAPDIVGAVDLAQGWGKAHVGFVAHNVDIASGVGVPSLNTWGYGVLGAIEVNIPGMKGGKVDLQGDYAHDAIGYSGLAGSYGFYNLAATPIFSDVAPTTGGTSYASSSAWSINGAVTLPVSATVSIVPEASYGAVSYGSGSTLANSSVFIGGATVSFTPVTNLEFDLDVLYQSTSISALSSANSAAVTADGLGAKFRIKRSF